MGGWCTLRAQCPRYHAEHRENPEERLCERGRDGVVVVSVEPWSVLRADLFGREVYVVAEDPPPRLQLDLLSDGSQT